MNLSQLVSHPLTKLFPVPKGRRPRFDLTLRILDLNNIPLVSGTAQVKWHLPSSSSAEHRGRTEKTTIYDHSASWAYVKSIPVRLTIDRQQMLQSCEVHFEITQEILSDHRPDRILLGRITLNLAEYVNQGEDDEGVVRRYLMQESKINSTLKIGIAMRQVDGDTNYDTPFLKASNVFGAITGVIAEQGGEKKDEAGQIPSINVIREQHDLQDMYRSILTASYLCPQDELPPDELIEDIFAGGDGFRGGWKPPISPDGASPSGYAPMESGDVLANRREALYRGAQKTGFGRHIPNDTGEMPGSHANLNEWRRSHSRQVSEFDARGDLRSWTISSEKYS